MALEQLHKVVARPVSLSDAAAVQDNSAGITNALITAETPLGVLGGSVAAVKNDGTYGPCTGAGELAAGLFGIDAAGEPFESNRPKDHGKITLVSGGFHSVDMYEVRNELDNADLTYTAADLLYVSARGLLTSDSTATANGGNAVALVEQGAAELGEPIVIKLLA